MLDVANVNRLKNNVHGSQYKSQNDDHIIDDKETNQCDEDPAQVYTESSKEASKDEKKDRHQVNAYLIDNVLLVDEPMLPLVLVASVGKHAKGQQHETKDVRVHMCRKSRDQHSVSDSSHQENHWVNYSHVPLVVLLQTQP